MVRRLCFTLSLGLMTIWTTGGPAAAIVTANPASANQATDPHLVNGNFDLNDHLYFIPELPHIDPQGVTEITIERTDRTFTCSAAVVNTPGGPQPRAILTAAHCVDNFRVVQVRAAVEEFGFIQYETCHETLDPGCDLSASIFIHPSYDQGVRFGYDLALIYFESPIGPFAVAYDVVDSTSQVWGNGLFVKFGFGCSGYGGNGVDETSLASYDHQKRWAVNTWNSIGLGSLGVEICGQEFLNHDTQLVLDFDDYSQVTHNLFNFYNHTFEVNGGYQEVDNQGYSWGVPGIEGWGCAGDSGGPNFVYDLTSGSWRIMGVSSYVFRIDDDYVGFTGNSDSTPATAACNNTGRDFSFGEFEGDALVNRNLLDQVLGLAPPSRSAKPGKVSDPEFGALGGGLLPGASP